MNRRASLPGVDALFGVRDAEPEAEAAAVPADVAEGLARVRRIAATEDDPLPAIRRAADDDAQPPTPEVGALLRWAVATSGARTVVEIGATAGVSGAWILRALPDGGVLTSLEPDADLHRRASDALQTTSSASRVRSIHGDVPTLLSRLADGAYDLVLLQTDRGRYPQHLARIRELLRPGGLLVARGTLPVGEHAAALEHFLIDLCEDEGFTTTALPVDDGVVIATRTGEA